MKTYYIFEKSNEQYVANNIANITSCPITTRMKLDSISSISNPNNSTPLKFYRTVIIFECDDNTPVDQTKVAYQSTDPNNIINWLNTI